MLFKNSRMKCLDNPTKDEILKREPLLKYSFYLSEKNNLLLDLLDEIVLNLDNGFTSDSIGSNLIGDASVLTWFWTLGAYEVIRTICQTQDCFSDSFYKKLILLKKELSKARMPSTKMEKQGKKEAVNSNRSPDGWDIINKDLLIGDPNEPVSARKLFKEYDNIMSSLTSDNVIKSHSDSEYYKSNSRKQQ